MSDKANDAVCTYQVVREFTNVAIKKFRGKLDLINLDDTYDKLFARVVVSTSEDFEFFKRGMILQNRYQLSFYDALIVQSAIDLGCDILYSEDFQHDQKIEGVKIVNPFLDCE